MSSMNVHSVPAAGIAHLVSCLDPTSDY